MVLPQPTHGQYQRMSLLRQYQAEPQLKLRNRIVQLNLGLVRKEAHRWVERCNESYEDLVQVGCLGLIRAIERFDATRGHAFSSFAMPYIRGEIQHYLRDKSPSIRMPRSWLALRHQAQKVSRQLAKDLNRLPSDREIAEALDIPLEQWQDIKLAYRNQEPVSLDCPLGEADEQATHLMDLVPDQRYRSFQLAQEDQIRLQQALAHLEKRTREILEFVFLHDLTQKEVAERLDISVITVSRRVKKGIGTLKSLMLRGEDH